MENYFDNEIKQIKREITNLKTSAQKSAGSLETKSASVSMEVELKIVGSGRPVANKMFDIESNTRDLAMITLDKYYDDIYANDHYSDPSRSAKVFYSRTDPFTIRAIVAFVGSEDDWTTIQGGGTVKMSATMTVRCTNDFEISEV